MERCRQTGPVEKEGNIANMSPGLIRPPDSPENIRVLRNKVVKERITTSREGTNMNPKTNQNPESEARSSDAAPIIARTTDTRKDSSDNDATNEHMERPPTSPGSPSPGPIAAQSYQGTEDPEFEKRTAQRSAKTPRSPPGKPVAQQTGHPQAGTRPRNPGVQREPNEDHPTKTRRLTRGVKIIPKKRKENNVPAGQRHGQGHGPDL